jgi:hypothetical protein
MVRNHENITLLPFPRDDDMFVRRAKTLLDEVDGLADKAQHLEDLLRAEYPDAVVRRRHAIGALDQSTEAWYVYRDGSLMRP